jgi:exodeoxyribonuclease VII large subunit
MIELITKLDTLSPLKTLARGYSIVEKNDNIVKSINDVKDGDEINIRLIDGKTKAKICN